MKRPLFLVAMAMLAGAGLILMARSAADVPTLGDNAVIESYTWMASKAGLLVGPYSRFQWHHPGPLSFYWLAPFYALSGERAAGLSAGALVLNLGALALITSIAVRRAGTILTVAVVAGLVLFAWRVAPLLTSAWNPHVIVFPLAAMILAAADVIAGEVWMLPIVAALASLIAQTHIALLPTGLVVGVAASVAAITRRHKAPLLVTIAVLGALWALPLLQQFTDRPGNISQLWTFFVSEPRKGQSPATAFYAWSDMLTGLIRPDFAVAQGLRFRQTPMRWIESLAVVQLLGLMVAAIVAVRRRRTFELALATLLLIASVLALWSATQIEETIFDHEVFWMAALGVINFAVLISLMAMPFARQIDSAIPVPAAAAWLLFASVALIGVDRLRMTIAESRNPSAEAQAVSAVAAELRTYLDRQQIVRPLIQIDQDGWPLAAGVILRLQKDGVAVATEDDWIPMFTPAFSASGREPVELAIMAKPQHVRSLGKSGDSVIIEHDPELFVHRISRPASVASP